MQFFIEVLVGGLLAGVMYSLVALGFVLIYKASGVFNFAQGALVLFAALTFVSIEKMGVPFWIALAITLGIMVLMGVAIERIVLRRLVNQPPISLFMASFPTRRSSDLFRCLWPPSGCRFLSKAWRKPCGAPKSTGWTWALPMNRSM